MINFFIKDKEDFIKSENKSYFIYKYTSIIFVISCLILLCLEKFYKYIGEVTYVASILFLIAILLDLYFLIKLFWGKTYAKIIYSILGYFAYVKATVIAKNIVYINTGANPDALQSSVDYLAGWLLIPAWIAYVGIILSFFATILALMPSFLMFFQDVNFSFLRKIMNEFSPSLIIYLEKKIFSHSFFFLLGIFAFCYYCDMIIPEIYKHSSINLVKEKIKENSYLINNGYTCNNKNIHFNDYIKLVGDDMVSVARIDNDGKTIFYMYTCSK